MCVSDCCVVKHRQQYKMKVKKVTKVRRSRLISSKRGVVVKGEWKAVNVDPSVFSDDGLDGLVCFEELTDYSLVEPEKALTAQDHSQTPSRAKKKKRKQREGDVKEKPANKKKKSQPEEEAEEVSVLDETLEDEDEDECPDVTPETPHKTSKKKKQRKKKKKKEETGDQSQKKEEEAGAQSQKKKKSWSRGQEGSEGQRSDVSAWKDLFVPAPVLEALSVLGFSAPTPIQALTLPPAIRDRLDILGAAETGSGKTLCFGIPMIHSVLEWRKASDGEQKTDGPEDTEVCVESLYLPTSSETPDSSPAPETSGDPEETETSGDTREENEEEQEEGADQTQRNTHKQPLLGLVLTPTRELAVQVKHHIDAVARFTGVKTAIVVGGMAPQKQQRVLMRRPEIVIATPGRLWEMIREKHPHLQNLRQLRCLVIDEADRMVEKGHFAELENLLEMLSTSQFNPSRQTFVFSATLTMEHSLPVRLQQKKRKKTEQRSRLQLLMEKVGIKGKPKVIDLTRKEATVETLTETRINCTKEEKDLFLYYFLLQYPGRSMVFANSIDCIKRLSALLQILDCAPLPLHANMHQKQRLKNLERFAESDSCVLLTTDVAARGLDIPNVQHVIHYQVPRTTETYVHRSGRTARAAREGLTLLLIGPDDLMNYRKICRTLAKSEELPVFPVQSACMNAIKERVTLARKIEKMEYFHSREKQHNSWVRQASEAMELDVDEELLLGGGKDECEEREQQRLMKILKKQLKQLISQPVFTHQRKTKYPTQMGRLQPSRTTADTALASLSRDTLPR
ncbi:ATP-dependent RNA helicase DDX24 isoform X1 [Carassius gibelio]|uniref:ATP-dependent RNA helicase DDX24 isoform X1 n=2 Tax=Carassius gibelio TaxID=101364 RepID=UPI0022787802|nr:ATP-dependent RNA helicase DDX24 isoform X1 [Carassius gibelio]